MKRLLSRIFFLTLICSAALFSACSSDDAPAVPVDPPVDPQPVPPSDRDVLAATLKKDAAVLADQLDFSAIETTSDATRQLLSLMGRGRYFMRDMQTAMVMITARNISERKLAYGLRVVFDEKANYRIGTTGGSLEFIFPATIGDYPKTLYKLTFASNKNWDAVPELFNLTLSGMFGDRERVLSKSSANIVMASDYAGMAAIALGAFAFDGRMNFFTPDDPDRSVCAVDLMAMRDANNTLSFGCDYEQGGRTVFDMTVDLPLPEDFVINSIGEAVEAAEGIEAVADVLGNLAVESVIADGADFMPALRDVMEGVKDKELAPEEFSRRVERLNGSLLMVIAGEDNTEPVPMKLLGEQGEEAYCVMPAFRFAGSSDYTPLKQVVDAATYDNLVEIYHKTALPVGKTAAAYSDLLTVMMQILPIPGTKQ